MGVYNEAYLMDTINGQGKRLEALELYKNLKVSVGYCAIIAEMTEEEFIKYLGENGVSIFSFESENEFIEELQNVL